MFTKVESQQGPEVRTFPLRFCEDVVVKSRGNPPNPGRDNLLDSLLGFLAAHPSKDGGLMEFSFRKLFGRFAFALRRFKT
jgi:hypothetical protein